MSCGTTAPAVTTCCVKSRSLRRRRRLSIPIRSTTTAEVTRTNFEGTRFPSAPASSPWRHPGRNHQRPALSQGERLRRARIEILRCSGTQFDPAVVEVFLKISNELWHELRSEITGQNKRFLNLRYCADPSSPNQIAHASLFLNADSEPNVTSEEVDDLLVFSGEKHAHTFPGRSDCPLAAPARLADRNR